jgi:hypothetical protein
MTLTDAIARVEALVQQAELQARLDDIAAATAANNAAQRRQDAEALRSLLTAAAGERDEFAVLAARLQACTASAASA